MGFKETLAKKYADAYLKKYGDRLTQIQGHILSAKITTKTILWIYHIIQVDILVKPDRSKLIMKCFYKSKRWFKKPNFIQLNQGNTVIVQGLKAKKNKKGKDTNDAVQVLNIRNLTTKIDLVPVKQKVQRVQQRQFIK